MELRLDDYKMDKISLSVPELLMMKVLDEHDNLSDILDSLQKAEYVSGFTNDNITFLSLTSVGKMILCRMMEEQNDDSNTQENDKRLEEIANAMREVYPKGFKKDDLGNDAYPWRGSVNSIKERLRKFEEKYYNGNKLDLDDAVEATRRYVNSCKKRDPVLLKVMKTLKYFIYKDGESLFLEWLDNEEGEDTYDESNGMTIL